MDAAERDRLEAVRELGMLDTPPEERFDRVVRLAQRLFGVGTVAVNLVDEHRLFTKSGIGLAPGTDTPKDVAFCPRTVLNGKTTVIADARRDPDWADNPLVTGDPHVRFYAGAPLAVRGGQVVGTLCLLDGSPRTMSEHDRTLLADLAGWVENELAADAEAVQAQELQRRLLAREAPQVPGYDVAGRCQPAMQVGGDYYDWQVLGETCVQLTVVDVMGKGLAGAVIAAGVRTALRVTSRQDDLAESVRRTAASLEQDFADTETFATMFTARLDTGTGALEYVDAGHGLALVVPQAGPVRHLTGPDLPLGIIEDSGWDSRWNRLDPGDTLVAVSDGILDAFADAADATAAAVRLARTAGSAAEMADRILATGLGHALGDDLTAVIVRREPA